MTAQEARLAHYVILVAGRSHKRTIEKMLCELQRKSISIIDPNSFGNSYRYKLHLDEQLRRYDRLINATRRRNT